MPHYRSNVRDLEFNLLEVFGYDRLLGEGPWSEVDVETARGMLGAAAELAEAELARTYLDADAGDIEFDPATGTARMPEAFRKTYETYAAAEWWRMDIPVEIGGIEVPQALRWSVAELSLGANPAIFLYAAGWPQAGILHRQGNAEQRRFAELMVERHWGATMVLTEPDAGSAVGSARTRAVPQPDGTWHIEGVKRFITSAEHDLAENIAHLVLARPVDTPGAGGPGTKGLSLFLVPKVLVDLATGELGERNGVYVTNIERKMGLKASTTCELTFGERHPAVGYLVGDVHDGIRQMFEVVEYARLLVGTKAMSTLSTAYLNAVDYARMRRQGADLRSRGDRSAPDVPIIEHPDVRRSLLDVKAHVEGLRSLVLFTTTVVDRVRGGGPDTAALQARADLLLPVVKGYASETATTLLPQCLQVFGGSGYLRDYPLEQYVRDAKIDTIYEGTTTIQGIDLFFRKIVRDDGAALGGLLDEVERSAAEAGPALEQVWAAVAAGTGEVRAIVSTLRSWADGAREDPDLVHRVAWCTTRLLMALGDLLVGWLLARQAEVALTALASGGVSAEDEAFYRGKPAAARFFAAERLPRLAGERAVIEGTDLAALAIEDASF